MHFHSFAVLRLLTLSLCAYHAAAWGSSKNQEVDSTVYGKSLQRDWLSSGSISIKLEGCVWGYVEDNEDAGCLDDSSEDGTYYWYQMANCRRAQAVVSVYASSGGFGGASCNSGNFQESVGPCSTHSYYYVLFLICGICSSHAISPRSSLLKTVSPNSSIFFPFTIPEAPSMAITLMMTEDITTMVTLTGPEIFLCANTRTEGMWVSHAPKMVHLRSSTSTINTV